MQLEGRLIVKEDEVNISASFKKREFVIEVANERNSDWNDFIKIQLTQDRCSLIDNIHIGENIKASINIRGRKWEKDGKVSYFVSIEAWRIEKLESANPTQSSQTPPPDIEGGEEENLPF